MSNPGGRGQNNNIILREESPSFVGQGAGEIPAEVILGKVQQRVGYSFWSKSESVR